MARQGTIAPKERVNIVYKSYTGDAEEEVELPFRFLVVGDFTGREDSTAIEQRKPVGIDKDSFDEVMSAFDVEAQVSVANKVSEKAAEELAVSVKFKQIKDFSPDSICQQVPELQALTELRDALTTLKGPLGNIPAFKKRLQATLNDPNAYSRLLEELNLSLDEDQEKGSE